MGYQSLRLPLVNANRVAIGIVDHRHVTRRAFHRLHAELYVVLFQMRNGVVKIFDFERDHAAIGIGREHSGSAADGQRIRAEFVFDPLAFENRRRFQAQHVLVKFPCPRHVGDGVATERNFGDFEHTIT